MIPAQYLFARKIAGAALATVVALLTACTTTPPPSEPIPPPAKKGITFTRSDYADLPAVDGHRWEAALTAFRQSCSRIRIDAVWSGLCSTALSLPNSAPAAESFFRSNFTPWGVEIPAKKGRTSTGLMTGYYEPLLYGSRVRQPPYVHPIYGIPDNLLTIDLGELYPDLKGRRLRGKLDGRRVVPYDKRGAIQEKEAEMARWAIAWVSDPVDAFFLHVQGSLCGDYQVGDIVIARKETFDSKPIVKRVIATAGQTVDIDFNLGQVYVDGELLDEDYINDYTYREEGTVFPLTVPEGEVFLMGDNRNHSNDSRDSSLGTVDTRLLIGKAVFLVFPGRDYLTEQREFGRIGLLQ